MSEREERSSEELEANADGDLPFRDAMSPIEANAAAPVSAAVALNALGNGSAPAANTEQNADIDQST